MNYQHGYDLVEAEKARVIERANKTLFDNQDQVKLSMKKR